MSKNKGKEIFEQATVQCLHCGRYLVRPMSHTCNTGFRKKHQKYLKLTVNQNNANK